MGEYAEARIAFGNSASPDLNNFVGQIISYIEQNNFLNARRLLTDAQTRYSSEPILSVIDSYIDILSGNARGAQSNLQAVLSTNSQVPLGWDLLALASVILGDNELASEAAANAVQQSPGSVNTLLITKLYTSSSI